MRIWNSTQLFSFHLFEKFTEKSSHFDFDWIEWWEEFNFCWNLVNSKKYIFMLYTLLNLSMRITHSHHVRSMKFHQNWADFIEVIKFSISRKKNWRKFCRQTECSQHKHSGLNELPLFFFKKKTKKENSEWIDVLFTKFTQFGEKWKEMTESFRTPSLPSNLQCTI